MGRSGPATIYCATEGPKFKLPSWHLLAARMSLGDGCWEWHGRFGKNGYAKYSNTEAHRLIWAHEHGPVPAGMYVCHRCDNPKCVRVDHLFLGTPQDNIDDMAAKGRAKFGWRTGGHGGRRKLTEEQVRTIRESSLPAKEIAATMGVSASHVHNIRAGLRRK